MSLYIYMYTLTELYQFLQGVKIVFQIGLALIRFCHDDLVSSEFQNLPFTFCSKRLMVSNFPSYQIKLPFEKLIHALKNFPEEAMNPDTLLPLAFSIKVILCFICSHIRNKYFTLFFCDSGKYMFNIQFDLLVLLDEEIQSSYCTQGLHIKIVQT